MKFLIVVLLNLSLIVSSYGQGWERFYEVDTLPEARFLVSTVDGGYLYGGNAADLPYYGHKTHVIKTDINGDTLWTRQIDFSGYNGIYDAIQTTDGGYMLAGYMGSLLDDIALVKLDSHGDTLWTKVLDFGKREHIKAVMQTIDGGYILAGETVDGVGSMDALLVKTNASGDTVWTKTFGGTASDGANDIQLTADGGYILIGAKHITNSSGGITGGGAFLIKTDMLGDTLWTKVINGSSNFASGRSVKQTLDGGYIFIGHNYSSNEDVFLVKTNSVGDTTWTWTYDSNLGRDWGISVIETTDGSYVFTGVTTVPPFPNTYNVYLSKVNNSGVLEWFKPLGMAAMDSRGAECLETGTGYAIVGDQGSEWNSPSGIADGLILIKTDTLGNVYTNYIKGNVFNDANFNCSKEQGERGFDGILVEAVGNRTWHAVTDSLGNYCIAVDTGSYIVNIHSPIYWQACNNAVAITFNNFFTTDTIDFPLQGQIQCPLMEVDISAPLIRTNGTGSHYTVNYCNNGAVDAINAYVDVTIDPALQVLGTSIPIVNQTGNLYRFNIGTVDYNNCGSFTINVRAQIGTPLGQTHCSEVHIYPDSICLPTWTGAVIEPNVSCNNDSVRFELENIGLGTFNTQTYYVFEDHVIMLIGNTGPILPTNSFDLQIAADTGKTYRISVAQETGFPAYLGDSIATIGIEGCVPYLDGTFNTGFITQFSNGNSAPYIAIDCQQNRGSYDPNDKSAQPAGYDSQHYIYDYTDLDYKIRFQNTGTDTAFLVVLRDTISPLLDLTTLTMGASSHPYTWRIYGAGILEVTFANIMLPDSNVNEAASNGFVRYRIEQKAGNALGSVIYNAADIYFDFNAPIRTNQTWHTIGDNFVPIVLSIENVIEKQVVVTAYPNPFMEITTIEVEGKEYDKIKLSVFDVTGKMVEIEQAYHNNKIELSRGSLATGVYIYRLEGDDKLINTGKIVVQ